MTDLYLRDLSPIVELQALELKRLMRDKEQLNRRIDSLVDEIGQLRAQRQQDQNWRTREQELRAKLQKTLGDLLQRADLAAKAAVESKPPAAARTPEDDVGKSDVSGTRAESSPDASPARKTDGSETEVKKDQARPEQTAEAADAERMEIPSFLAEGPRVGFDRTTAEDIRSIHGPSRASGEAPIKRLLDRIRARNNAP